MSRKLGETVICSGFEVVSIVGASLYSLCVPTGFDRRAGSDMSMNHVFMQVVLVSISFVGGEAGDGGANARVRC